MSVSHDYNGVFFRCTDLGYFSCCEVLLVPKSREALRGLMGEVVLRSRYRKNCPTPNRDLLPLSSVEMAFVWMVIRAARKIVSRLEHVGSVVCLAVPLR